ncbi:MAG: cytidine deaminase [Eubacteriales bacterium]|nr:cytidine deaminase [Eubacteriales bacterium]
MEERALRSLAPRDCGEEDQMTDDRLYEMACEALERAYCPYSHCQVGAALLCEDGSVVTGVNVENASYGATICAERSAVFAAVSQGKQRFVKIAIAGSAWVAWPCGMCRQVLAEFALPGFEVIAGEKGKPWQKSTLAALLPYGFGPEEFGAQ